jgi:hypothetical protein
MAALWFGKIDNTTALVMEKKSNECFVWPSYV